MNDAQKLEVISLTKTIISEGLDFDDGWDSFDFLGTVISSICSSDTSKAEETLEYFLSCTQWDLDNNAHDEKALKVKEQILQALELLK